MASNINTTNIDTAYPIAGQDNDSQGFRDNFTNINSNFVEAKSEIEALQADVLAIEAGQAVTLSLGTVSTPQVIDITAAAYQTMTLGASISLSFIGFPAVGTLGVVQLEVTVTDIADTLTLPAAVTVGIDSMPGIAGQVVNFSSTGVYIFEFASANSGGIISVHNLTPGPDAGISNVVEDTTPQLGGALDVNGQSIVSVSAGDIAITPDTTGNIVLDGLNWPQADGTVDQVLKTNGAGQLGWTDVSTTVSDDATPSLGGDLDVNGNAIVSVAAGDIAITPDTTGSIILDGLSWPQADGTDGQVLVTDGLGRLSWAEGGGGADIGDVVFTSTVGEDEIFSTKDSFVLSAGSGLCISMDTGAATPDSGYDFAGAPAATAVVLKAPDNVSVTRGALTSDGSKLLWSDNDGSNPKTVHVRNLGTPFDISTVLDDVEESYTGGSSNGGAGIFQFSDDGTKMFATYLPHDTIWEYTLSTPYLISSAGLGTQSNSMWGGSGDGNNVISQDGFHVYSTANLGGASNLIGEWTLGTAWDISTLSALGPSSTKDLSADIGGKPGYYDIYAAVNADGTSLYVLSTDIDFIGYYINQWDMGTPHDLTTAVYNAGVGEITLPDAGLGTTIVRGFQVSPDGTNAYVFTDLEVQQFDISAGDAVAGATSTTLYYDDSETLTTTADGIDVVGDIALSGRIVEPVTSYGTTGAIALDTSSGTYFYPTGTTTGSITFSFTNPAPAGNITAFTLEMLGAGNNAPVWPAGVEWDSGTEPTWTTGKDIVSFISRDGGTTWVGMLGGTAFA